MSSIGGAIRKAIVDAGIEEIASRVYRDIAPPEAQYPYVTIGDEVSNQPALLGDRKVIARLRLVRVNLWQLRAEEKTPLIDEIVRTLDTKSISANQLVLRVRVFDIQRIFDAQDDTISHVITLNVVQKAQ